MVFSWLFRGLFCLEKQCSGLFRYFFVVFSWFFRGFFVAPVLGKFYAYSPWNSLLRKEEHFQGVTRELGNFRKKRGLLEVLLHALVSPSARHNIGFRPPARNWKEKRKILALATPSSLSHGKPILGAISERLPKILEAKVSALVSELSFQILASQKIAIAEKSLRFQITKY